VFDDSRPAAIPKPVEATPRKTECVTSADGGKIVPPKKIRDLAPQYPDHLRGTGTEGVVKMEAVIGADGIVGEVRPIGSGAGSRAGRHRRRRQWRYTQTLLNCQPVE
jgi:outer membrane biosynthesis protein TonB